MRILFTEENAQDYLKCRQLLEEQANDFNMDWAPNSEIALKQIKENSYHLHLIGYDAKKTEQHKFLAQLYENTKNTPTILLTKNNELVDTALMDKYQTFCLPKEQLNWPQLKRSIRYLSNLLAWQKNEARFHAVFNKAFEFMGLLKSNGILQDINTAALTFVGYQRSAMEGIFFWDMPWTMHSQKNQARLKKAIATVVEGDVARCEIEIRKHNGQRAVLDFLFTPIANAQNEIVWILVEGRDLEQQFANITLHDQLTELPNRHKFMEYLEKAMDHASQRQDYYIAVLLLDLERFRVINASLGHDLGDWLLMEISQRLQDCLNEKHILARAGGDEFIILLDEMQDFVEATTLAATIKEVLARPFSLVDYDIVMSCSIGIAYYTDQEESAELLRDADAAMYHAKTMGQSGYAVFRHDMRNRVVSRLQMETDLLHAIEQKKFVLFYQPQIELASGRLVGMESLIRFQHPQNGFVSPLDFIPVLEDTGNIIPIGEWILRTACSQFRAWWDAGLSINHVAVNLSAHQFHSKNLITKIIDFLEKSGLEPDSLELEITESLLLEDAESAITTLGHLKSMGLRVTIDDFGTGYSSLSYLKRFPVDCLKIDNTFIDGIISSPVDTAITVATIDMAHALGLKVIAVGVETTEQRDFLRDLGCDFAQGYLYAAPMEKMDFVKWAKQYSKS